MSREIKFRAWDKLSKQWIPGGYGFHVLGEALLIGGLFQNMPLEMLNDIELMQFTGLRDKNGKEIYEGDILSWDGSNVGAVSFEHCEFIVGGDEKGRAMCALKGDENIEVIGNIHENGDLLKVGGGGS